MNSCTKLALAMVYTELSMSSTTKPEVFIIESLEMDDEAKDRREGQRIASMLQLSGKRCKYFYLRSRVELKRIMREFRDSEYRYLHLSCHGDKTGLATTFDDLGIPMVGKIMRPFIDGRRVFLSACAATTPAMASALMQNTSCYSLMGPSCNISFNDAALFWATFYHLMFKQNDSSMKRDTIIRHGTAAAKTFGLQAKLFARDGGAIRPYDLT